MFDPQMELLLTVLQRTVDDPTDERFAEARQAYDAIDDEDADVAAALESKDATGLGAVVGAWLSGARLLLLHDREVLKRAMKAYRKSLKVTRLDEESSLGGGSGMTSGRQSSIVGIRPPERYPIDVWKELARQKRLIDSGHGTFELPPGG
jgi:hypothetical protein